MDEIKRQAEAILFSVGKRISIEEIAKLCREPDLEKVRKALEHLQREYDDKASSLMVIEDGISWKLTVREKYAPIVKKIVIDTELPKSVLETLAVIAWKNPVKQSDVIKVRTNKAYDHISELEQLGFITSKKHGRTMIIRLTEKFFTYFDLDGDKDIRKIFKRIKDPELKIFNEEQQKLDTEKLGALEVFDEPGQIKEKIEIKVEKEPEKKPTENATLPDTEEKEVEKKPEAKKPKTPEESEVPFPEFEDKDDSASEMP